MLIVYSPRCLDYASAGHPESPERVRNAVARLRHNSHTWVTPEPCSEPDILLVHSPGLLGAVKSGRFYDPDTPFFPNIYELARLSAGSAILAAEKALAGQLALSLMRPPGHHATREQSMGFCYFNNIAIAIRKIQDQRKSQASKVAILDFDCHHGNGTEDIFMGDHNVLYISIHQSPCYPGTGLTSHQNCLNYPLPPGTQPKEFLAAIDEGLHKIRLFRPALLALSSGFDAYRRDPITNMGLEIETYQELGSRIGQARCPSGGFESLPCFAVLEGGYSDNLDQCVEAFVTGLSNP